MLGIYLDEYYQLSAAKIKKMDSKYDSDKLFLKKYNYGVWVENEKLTYKEESTDKEESADKEESVDLSDIPALESGEVKEGKGLKILTPGRHQTRRKILIIRQIRNQTNTISFVST